MNTTNTTSTEVRYKNSIYMVSLLVPVLLTGFHGCAIYVFVKSKELKKVRFLHLALCLSLSDCAIGIELMYSLLLNHFDNGEKAIILTGNVSVGLCFAIPHSYALVRFGITAWIYGIDPCGEKSTSAPIGLLTHDIPVLLLVASITGVYGVVATRMMEHQKKMRSQGTNLTETQLERNRINASRMQKNMATLGMIIIIAVISAVPRSVIGLYIYITDSYDTVESYFQISMLLMLLKPLLDPVIYLFRIKKYREQLICKCCCRSKGNLGSNK